MVIGGISDFVVDMVKKRAIPKIVAMFIPGAGFISAIVSIYDTVMVFVNKISKIIQVVTGFINSISAIASGAIGAAASRVENTLAGLLSLAINFLAGFAGLGKVSDKVMGVINTKARTPVDKAIDWLINWIVTMAKKLFAKVFGKKDKDGKPEPPSKVQRPRIVVSFALGDASHELILDPKGGVEPQVEMASGAALPFDKKQRDAYNAIEYFKQYMTSITDAQVRREYETKLRPEIDKFQVANVDAWKQIYKAKFPSDKAESPISDVEARSRAEVVAKEAEVLLAKLKSWGATSGIPDLSKDLVNNTLQTKGMAIWKDVWLKRKQEVDAAIASVNYKGVPLAYRGSLAKGYKGPQKNQTRFNPNDFDVDLYVVHPDDFDTAVMRGAKLVGGQIFPDNPFAPRELASVSRAARKVLMTKLPDIARMASIEVSLRREAKA
jgi:hypothetical protein